MLTRSNKYNIKQLPTIKISRAQGRDPRLPDGERSQEDFAV